MIRIGNKINAHGGIFITDTAHSLMERMRSFHVLYGKRQMKFIFPRLYGSFLSRSQVSSKVCPVTPSLR